MTEAGIARLRTARGEDQALRIAGALLAWCLLPVLALAQDASPDYTLLGAGARSRPVYDGSDRHRSDLVPVVRYYGRPWFARTTQGLLEAGARVELAPGLAAGAQLVYEQGPRDRDVAASAGVHLEWDWKTITLLGRLRQQLDSDRGAQADARLTAGVLARGPVLAGLFAQATWANAASTEAYYGAREPGLLFASVGALGSVDLARRWVAVGTLEARRLASDLARSPFVEQRSGSYASAGVAYRF